MGVQGVKGKKFKLYPQLGIFFSPNIFFSCTLGPRVLESKIKKKGWAVLHLKKIKYEKIDVKIIKFFDVFDP